MLIYKKFMPKEIIKIRLYKAYFYTGDIKIKGRSQQELCYH